MTPYADVCGSQRESFKVASVQANCSMQADCEVNLTNHKPDSDEGKATLVSTIPPCPLMQSATRAMK
jgi:hypothetical protein